MISHKHKCIFIHIPKTAGTSIYEFFFPDVKFKHLEADYDRLFGWCPKRNLYLQHATTDQLLDTGLIDKRNWEEYYKFTFVRNPWDRAYSDFKWMKKHHYFFGSFKEYITTSGKHAQVLLDNSTSDYRGDHLIPQKSFFYKEGPRAIDFLGRFESFEEDIQKILNSIGIKEKFNIHSNPSTRSKDYSNFYTNSMMELVNNRFEVDIKAFKYTFDDKRKGLQLLKKLF